MMRKVVVDTLFPLHRAGSSCFVAAFAFLLGAASVWAQGGQGPITPPPNVHIHRETTNNPTPVPAPALAPEEIIQRFSQKEAEYLQARAHFGYTKEIRITEYGLDGKPSGEYRQVTQSVVGNDGYVSQRMVDQPVSTLHFLIPEPPDLEFLANIPFYPLVPQQLSKYDITYEGREKVGEIDCYIFDVKPKILERAYGLFQGVVWVDSQYLEVVKTYGKYVTDLGDMHPVSLPFANFETFREYVDDKYWFPDYSQSDDYIHLKDHDVPVRVVIKWTNFKPLTPPPAAAKQTAAPANLSQPQR
jgi:hypothetical protein